MQKQFVTYEVALKLKEAGFDESTRFSSLASLYSKDGKHCFYANYGFMGSGLSDGYIWAPTYQQVIDWLFKKLDLWYPYLRFKIYGDDSGSWSHEAELQIPSWEKCFNGKEQAILVGIELLKKYKK